MPAETGLQDENTSQTLQVDTGQDASSQHIGSQRSARCLWTGLGLVALMLIGISACAPHPLASHALVKSSGLLPGVGSFQSILGHKGIHPARHPGSGFRSAVHPGARSASLPVMKQPLESWGTPGGGGGDGGDGSGEGGGEQLDFNNGAAAQLAYATGCKDRQEFSGSSARLIFDGKKPWKDWEIAGVKALEKSIGRTPPSSKGEKLRFLHLAISYRNDGNSGDNFTEEDVELARDLLIKRQVWLDERRPTWTPKLRNTFKDIVFLQGSDKSGRPFAIVRPNTSNRKTWIVGEDLTKCILALVDKEIDRAYLPGVAEQAIFIIDLQAVGFRDIASLVPSLQTLMKDLTDNYPSRGGTFSIINAGITLSAAMGAVGLFLQAETRDKIQVFRSGLGNCAGQYFDMASLPKEFGGQGAMSSLSLERRRSR